MWQWCEFRVLKYALGAQTSTIMGQSAHSEILLLKCCSNVYGDVLLRDLGVLNEDMVIFMWSFFLCSESWLRVPRTKLPFLRFEATCWISFVTFYTSTALLLVTACPERQHGAPSFIFEYSSSSLKYCFFFCISQDEFSKFISPCSFSILRTRGVHIQLCLT